MTPAKLNRHEGLAQVVAAIRANGPALAAVGATLSNIGQHRVDAARCLAAVSDQAREFIDRPASLLFTKK